MEEPGKDVIVPPPTTSEEVEQRHELVKDTSKYNMLDWFLTFKKDDGK